MCHVACQEQEPLPILAWTIGSNVSRQRLHHRSRNRDGAVFIGLVVLLDVYLGVILVDHDPAEADLLRSGSGRGTRCSSAAPSHGPFVRSTGRSSHLRPTVGSRREADPTKAAGHATVPGSRPYAHGRGRCVWRRANGRNIHQKLFHEVRAADSFRDEGRVRPGRGGQVPPRGASKRASVQAFAPLLARTLSPGSAAPTRRADISGSPQDPPPRPRSTRARVMILTPFCEQTSRHTPTTPGTS
jgi:hypothetical protein